jgi:hypothetical protein
MRRWRNRSTVVNPLRKRGRPRRLYARRYKNDDIVKPTVEQRKALDAKAEAEAEAKSVALAQPHRANSEYGADNRLLESPLGVVVLKHRAPKELWVRGCNFALIFMDWASAIGGPGHICGASHVITRNGKNYTFWAFTTSSDADAEERAKQHDAHVITRSHQAVWRLRKPLDEAESVIRKAAGLYRPPPATTASRSPAGRVAPHFIEKLHRDQITPEELRARDITEWRRRHHPNSNAPRCLGLIYTLCVSERSLNCDADELLALEGLRALERRGAPLHPDAPSLHPARDARDEAMKIYDDQLELLRHVYNVED